jgi:hypothetical protein
VREGLTRVRARAELDSKHYLTGINVSDTEWTQVRISKNDFRGDRNHDILPN